MNLSPPKNAFTPFLRHLVKVVAKGPSGSSGDYRDTLKVGILYGQPLSQSAGSPMQPAVANAVTVIIAVSDWKAEYPPALGNTFESDEVPRLTVQSLPVRTGDRWHLACTQDMRAKKS